MHLVIIFLSFLQHTQPIISNAQVYGERKREIKKEGERRREKEGEREKEEREKRARER